MIAGRSRHGVAAEHPTDRFTASEAGGTQLPTCPTRTFGIQIAPVLRVDLDIVRRVERPGLWTVINPVELNSIKFFRAFGGRLGEQLFVHEFGWHFLTIRSMS